MNIVILILKIIIIINSILGFLYKGFFGKRFKNEHWEITCYLDIIVCFLVLLYLQGQK
jgi:hypothetical protein